MAPFIIIEVNSKYYWTIQIGSAVGLAAEDMQGLTVEGTSAWLSKLALEGSDGPGAVQACTHWLNLYIPQKTYAQHRCLSSFWLTAMIEKG
jgi:hypothetical protein